MNRTIRLVPAVITAGVCLGALGAVAVPAHAAARTYTIGVRAIDRTGKAVKANGYLINVKDGREHPVGAGRTRKVPAGTYAVTTEISTGETVTWATRVVSVSRSQYVSFDARQGRQVRFGVDDPTAEVTSLNVLPLVRGRWAMQPTDGSTPPKGTYVIPMKSKYVTFAAHAVLEKKGTAPEQASPYRYDLVRVHKGGIPQKPSYYDRRSKLARVDVSVRSIDADQTGWLSLEATGKSNSSYLTPLDTSLGALPRTVISYRTPGYKWHPNITINGPHGNARIWDSNNDPVYAARRYKETWGGGVWGPGPRGVDANMWGRRLLVYPRTLICQPPHTVNEDCELSGVTKFSRLYRGRTLLAQGKGDLSARISTKSTWYTLKSTASRPQGALLSTRLWSTWRFKARGYDDSFSHGGASLLTVIYTPWGLDGRNHAARGSLTKIPVYVRDGSGHKLAVKSIIIEASVDGGKTWRRTSVKRDGKRWMASVRNPGTAGFVSLRATVKDARGNTVWQTIANAYGVR
ncbi:hypothetical protein SMC26_31480 [Actinomadura fulvescens]|uniref:Uncharacterized protein n=1 Tax=Actinomadura fulvescens TaxID=46160 RepID=A0ABN3Q1K2_9ACTN